MSELTQQNPASQNGTNGKVDSLPKVPRKKTNPVVAKSRSTLKVIAAAIANSATDQPTATQKRIARPYPASSFQEALPLAEAIHKFAAGQRVRRLTLLKQMDKSPTSSSTRMLITSSSRYGITIGSHSAEWLELTELGTLATSNDTAPKDKLHAQFKLAIENIPAFNKLYTEHRGKKLPTHDVLKDVLTDNGFNISELKECIDYFVVNAKFIGLLQTIAGSETLLPIEQVLDETHGQAAQLSRERTSTQDFQPNRQSSNTAVPKPSDSKIDWSRSCFVVTPIGEDGSETRQHADLFLNHLIEPALREFNFDVVRADKIGSAGMITTQILEYVMRSRLVIVDLSYHNPNAFYEMAIRHACKLPVVQISRRADRLPFDVNQVRTVVVDTTDIYTLVPKLETYRSEIATQARAALADGSPSSNPISVFFPGFEVIIPRER